jgi:hypothetical protein
VFPVRYELNSYINLLRNSLFKGLIFHQILFLDRAGSNRDAKMYLQQKFHSVWSPGPAHTLKRSYFVSFCMETSAHVSMRLIYTERHALLVDSD